MACRNSAVSFRMSINCPSFSRARLASERASSLMYLRYSCSTCDVSGVVPGLYVDSSQSCGSTFAMRCMKSRRNS